MSNRFQAIRGFNDVLPDSMPLWHHTERVFQDVARLFAYREVRLPILEPTQLFKRTIGEVTDIVEKEMYTFQDMNGDSLSMRPEGTAGCVRAMIEHGLLRQAQKLWYLGPMFRHEKPQKGRYRQFYQFGVEVFGLPEVAVELELMVMTQQIWKALGIADDVELEINCLGTSEDRIRYRQKLTAFFEKHIHLLSAEEKTRLQRNPLRLLDSKSPELQNLLTGAPKLLDELSPSSREQFDLLCQGLEKQAICYRVNSNLVRGLDYYHDLVFEWVTPHLGTQATVCAGGRYNGLVEQLGGPSVPAVGFAMGIERLILLQEQLSANPSAPQDIYLLTQESQPLSQSLEVATRIRQELGLSVEMSLSSVSFKSQFKKADKSGARFALILGQEELNTQRISIKALRAGESLDSQITLSLDELIIWLRNNKS